MSTPLTQMKAPILMLGPAHAGKSQLATQMLAPDRPAIVIGTATPMAHAGYQRRLQYLRSLRPPGWETIEPAPDLAAATADALRRSEQVLIDSISQWLAGLVVEAEQTQAYDEAMVEHQTNSRIAELLTVLSKVPSGSRVVVVSSEMGAAPAPPRALERLYRRLAGETHQRLAAWAATVVMIQAGIPVAIKSP